MTTNLKEDYLEQLDFYGELSQEEIVALYATEGITDRTIFDAIKEYKREISSIKLKLEKIQSEISSNWHDDCTLDTAELRRSIEVLGSNIESLENVKKNIGDLNIYDRYKAAYMKNDITTIINDFLREKRGLEDILYEREKIEKIKESRNPEIQSLQEQKNDLENKVRILYAKVQSVSHGIYMNMRGIMPKSRKFPSLELRNQIVCGNLWIARKYAAIYCKKSMGKLSFDDATQIAYEALVSAVHYYIPSDRATFVTYATACIVNKLKQEIWPKKREKVKINGAKDFLTRLEDNITYINMYIDSLKYTNDKGKEHYSSRIPSNRVLYKANLRIKEFNKDKIFREQPNRKIKLVYKRKKLAEMAREFHAIIKDSNFGLLIGEDEIEVTNILVNYEGYPRREREIRVIRYCLEWYLKRLQMIKMYLDAERELIIKNNGFVPEEDEILEAINDRIKDHNEQRYLYIKDGLFPDKECKPKRGNPDSDKVYKPKKKRPVFVSYASYYFEYLYKYGVDFLCQEDKNDKGISRKTEKANIVSEYEKQKKSMLSILRSLEEEDDKNYILYFSEDNLFCIELLNYYGRNIKENGVVLSRSDAINLLKRKTEELPDSEQYLKMVLKKRVDVVNAIINEKNKKVIEQNRKIAKLIDMYNSGKSYDRHIQPDQFEQIREDIKLLFYQNQEELSLLLRGREATRRSIRTTTEVEAMDNLFLEDYHKQLEGLPEEERKIMIMYYEQDMSGPEIAGQIDICTATVYRLKAKAIGSLKNNRVIQGYKSEQ